MLFQFWHHLLKLFESLRMRLHKFYNLHCSLIREDYFIHAAIRSIKSSKLSPSSIRCVRPFSMSSRPRCMAAISSGVNSSSFQPFPSLHLTKALTLDKGKSKKNARNNKVFPFFLRSNLFPSRTAGKRYEQRPQQDVKTPFFSTSFAKHTFQSSGTNHKKRCISPQKWGKEGAFFPFSLIFRTNIEKKQ